MSRARLLVISEVVVERSQMLPHRPRFRDRHIVVGVTMQNVDALMQVVAGQRERVAGRGGALQQLLHGITRVPAIGSGVGPEADPARAWRDGSEAVGESHAELPGPMPAHRVSGQIRLVRIGFESRLREREHFHGVMATPVFPIETVRPAIRGRDHGTPGFRRVRARHAHGLHGRAVGREKQRAGRLILGKRQGRGDSVILDAVVNVAPERLLIVFIRPTQAQRTHL